MRKISFANKLAISNKLGPISLYSSEDIKLTESEFKERVKNNLKQIITTR
jgi:hypothetical protein